jgi:hypothetical protein
MSQEPEQLRLEEIRTRFRRAGYLLDLAPTPDGDWQARWYRADRPDAAPALAVAATRLDAAEDALALIEGREPPLAAEELVEEPE